MGLEQYGKNWVAWLLAFVVLFAGVGISAFGQQTLYVAKTTDAVSLDPHNAAADPSVNVYVNIYEALTKVSPTGTVEPALAISWEAINSETMRFHLRKGVTFQDGTPFDAAAVKFNIERAINPKDPARVAGDLGPISGVKVIDQYTVDVTTSVPYGPIALSMADFTVIGMCSPAAVEKYGDSYGQHPVGTGPFKFVKWIPNQSIVLERYDGYWGPKPKLDRIVYKIIPDLQAQDFALKRGQVQVLLNPDPARIATYSKDSQFTVHETPSLRVMLLGFDTAAGRPTASLAIRQAIAHAIDSNLICQTVLEGTATPATSFITPGYFGYANEDLQTRYDYNVATARSILAGAGWTDRNGDGLVENSAGQHLQILFYAPQGRYPNDKQTAVAVQAMLQAVGIDCKLVIAPWATYIANLGKPVSNGGIGGSDLYDMFLVGWADLPDAALGLAPLYDSSDMPPGNCCDWFFYNNAKVDTLLESAGASSDQSARAQMYRQVQDILAADLPALPYAFLDEIVVTTKDVQGYTIAPLDYYRGFFGDTYLASQS